MDFIFYIHIMEYIHKPLSIFGHLKTCGEGVRGPKSSASQLLHIISYISTVSVCSRLVKDDPLTRYIKSLIADCYVILYIIYQTIFIHKIILIHIHSANPSS